MKTDSGVTDGKRVNEIAENSDIEVLFDGLPEPIDLALNLSERHIDWTDRGDNAVRRAAMDVPSGEAPSRRTDREVLVRGLNEAIGLTLDLSHGDLHYTDLGGSVGTAKLDGANARTLARGKALSPASSTRSFRRSRALRAHLVCVLRFEQLGTLSSPARPS